MKKLLIALCSTGLLFAACKEKAPYIRLTDANYVDSGYSVATLPATDPHQVYIEEFTGESCSNCPAAHEQLHQLDSIYQGRLNIVGLYSYNISQTVPPAGAGTDFRDSAATSIGVSIYGGISQLPNGGFDRSYIAGNKQVTTNLWNGTITDRLNIVDSLNLKIESHTSASGSDTIVATVVYTKDVAGGQNLSVLIIEDSIVDVQEFPLGFINPSYVFTNVFRQSVSAAPFGDPLLVTAATKTAGLALKRTYVYNRSSHINRPAHCRVIAFVSNGTDSHVMQSCQAKLMP
jgi:hypothetical protein